MMRRLFLTLAVGAALAAGSAAAQSATTATIAAAKSAGQVGEQGDGFLGLVTGEAPTDVKAAVAEINAGRAGAYHGIAAKTGVSDQAAGEATARQLIEKAAPGSWVKPLGGSWTKK